MAYILLCYGMKMTALVVIMMICLCGNQVIAQNKDLTPFASFVGARMSVVHGSVPVGVEAVIAVHVAGPVYAGINFGDDVGKSSDHYGYNITGAFSYFLDISNLGLNLEWLLFHNKTDAMSVHLLAGIETVSFGAFSNVKIEGQDYPFYTPTLTFHDPIVKDHFYSIRPGVSYYTRNFGIMVSYNFLKDIPLKYSAAKFGSRSDFEGLIVGLNFRTKYVRRYHG